jgi:hypothetical protein
MSYVLGQIQSFVNAALAAMLLAWRLNRRIAAGVALGIACLIKPHSRCSSSGACCDGPGRSRRPLRW